MDVHSAAAGIAAVDIYRRPLTLDLLELVRRGYQNQDDFLLTDERTAIKEVTEFKIHGATRSPT